MVQKDYGMEKIKIKSGVSHFSVRNFVSHSAEMSVPEPFCVSDKIW